MFASKARSRLFAKLLPKSFNPPKAADADAQAAVMTAAVTPSRPAATQAAAAESNPAPIN